MKIREYVYCVKCGVLDKLEHQEGLECIREHKLKEILK